jgi:hypothetical protein
LAGLCSDAADSCGDEYGSIEATRHRRRISFSYLLGARTNFAGGWNDWHVSAASLYVPTGIDRCPIEDSVSPQRARPPESTPGELIAKKWRPERDFKIKAGRLVDPATTLHVLAHHPNRACRH